MGYKNRCRALVRRGALVAALAGAGLVLAPGAAHAAEVRSATGNGWGPDWATATAAAENNAYHNLIDQARAVGETCTNITYTASLYYIVPGGGGYVFMATATGTCA